MQVFLASDHGGYILKNKLVEYLKQQGYVVEDLGPHSLDPNDDYPLYAEKLAKQVTTTADSLGIILCRNGVGIAIACNKIDGARCALSWQPKHAASTRKDDNANILSLPADYLNEDHAKETALAFLQTKFEPTDRFVRRLDEITEIEKEQ